MPIVYSMFAVTLGACLGTWRRHTVSAIGLTLGIFVALQLVVGMYARAHYMAPFVTKITSFSSYPNGGGGSIITRDSHTTGPEVPGNEWQLSFNPTFAPQSCAPSAPTCSGTDTVTIVWQPANRYWPFQFIEAGLYLGLTAALVGTTYWLVLKRDIS